jgi:CRP-like cAMP-binding protein
VSIIENQLIGVLPHRERASILAVCEAVYMIQDEVLIDAGTPVRHVYLPRGGFVSLVSLMDAHPSVGVALVGREGIVGAQLALGISTAPLGALVQGQGAAWRVETAAFQNEMDKSMSLRRSVENYLYLLVSQLSRSAGCAHLHRIGPRLARWLLMSQDSAQSPNFHVTHEFLGQMLGVRRVGITSAAGLMQRHGLIEYRRGELTILDRGGLKAFACSCYAADRRGFAVALRTPRDAE